MSSPDLDHVRPDQAAAAARDFAVEPAAVDICVGFSADDHPLHATVDVVGPPRTLASSERSFLSEAVVVDA
jgi:beta-glucosidase